MRYMTLTGAQFLKYDNKRGEFAPNLWKGKIFAETLPEVSQGVDRAGRLRLPRKPGIRARKREEVRRLTREVEVEWILWLAQTCS